ncbi:hypothetical protein [Nostoc sp.]
MTLRTVLTVMLTVVPYGGNPAGASLVPLGEDRTASPESQG